MNGLIGDRFLKRFLKGVRRLSKSGSASEAEVLEESSTERANQSDDLEKTETLEKTDECSKKFHYSSGVSGKCTTN